MYEGDQEHTGFISNYRMCCYKVMPFGLKNARATYQQLMATNFSELIRKNLEVYIDDILFKIQKIENHVRDLEEAFQILLRFQMRLNLEKCTFRSWKILGYIISERGIEAYGEQVKAILDMLSSRNKKGV